ncbi:hypothetical protein [Solimonas sp. K1W22B-7]|nr:hypothetical protein [Solimonas sp. K1W22B-7]
MSENTRIWLLVAVALLLVAVAAWYFDPPAPQLCLDGACHELF